MAEGRDQKVDLRGASIDVVRGAIVAVTAYACNGTEGRFQGEPIFDEVTEGRQDATDRARLQNPSLDAYSGCTDLFSYAGEAVGVEDETFVNRNDDGGRKPWQVGGGPTFITRADWYRSIVGHPDLMASVGPGDALVVASPWHVCMVVAVDIEGGTITVDEYGGFDTKKGKACGRRATHTLKRVGAQWILRNRVVQGFVSATEFAKRITGIARMPDDYEATS